MVDFNLQPGVRLHVKPTSRFHVNRIQVNFATPQTVDNPASRNLLANLLETSTAKYPTQTAFAKALNHLYGADASASVGRIGYAHTLRVRAEAVDDRFAQPGVFASLVEILYQMIFCPLIKDGAFDEATFKTQRQNVVNELASIKENKQYYAAWQLDRLYYDQSSLMRIPSYGRLKDLEKITPSSLVSTYHDMLDHDQVDIFVYGNVDPQMVFDLFSHWPLKPRQSPLPQDVCYRQPFHHRVRELTEHQDVNQAKLNLAYHFPVFYRDENYYAALVMNGILGGTPYSKLFANVREKASLAYYASSQLRLFSSHLAIQTGIDAQNRFQAQQLIEAQVKAVQAGDFTEMVMQEVKDALINQYQTGLDAPGGIVEHWLVDCMSNHLPAENVVESLQQVSHDQVAKLAQKLQLQAVYFLDGEE
ncbi:insulinase family protein [Lactobacillus sp. MRS-253-APC-2B]|uniref:EF-P 5-aminopentanol modification-associated protein YfmF n=1 Tax=Lactobacillus sp. MRS-253-APC-2B TaxID=2725305 RepID=UPI00146ED088|nr:pitrilysin family protein [Lactobacillus sp. MRS-253-APC-2B]NME33239.1 insulinase family protein [Lactobacillus sp. MRS-253-APC-2B]